MFSFFRNVVSQDNGESMDINDDGEVLVPAFTLTENGALAYCTSGDEALDFFTTVTRGADIQKYVPQFINIVQNNPHLAVKILLNMRDPRNGKGERLIPRVLLFVIKVVYPVLYEYLFLLFIYYGSWKDVLFVRELGQYYEHLGIGSTDEFGIFCNQLCNDYQKLQSDPNAVITLASKWAPSEKSRYNKNKLKFATEFMARLNVTPKQYRKMLAQMRKHLNVLEVNMSTQDFSNIDFSHVPSVAHKNHSKAFGRSKNAKGVESTQRQEMSQRYVEYLEKLKSGSNDVKINSKGLQPHELTTKAKNSHNETIQQQWNDLVNKIRKVGTFDKTIAIVDVSGSMTGQPMDVAVALGILVSQCSRNVRFKDKVITFDSNPKLIDIGTMENLHRKVQHVYSMPWGYNTDIVKVFKMLLDHATMYGVSAEDMIDTVFIFTDMQFDKASGHHTTFDHIRGIYESKGYNLPKIVCWNLRTSCSEALPFEKSKEGVAMLSGFSSELLKAVLDSDMEQLTPLYMMKKVLDRYDIPELTTKHLEKGEDIDIRKLLGAVNKIPR